MSKAHYFVSGVYGQDKPVISIMLKKLTFEFCGIEETDVSVKFSHRILGPFEKAQLDTDLPTGSDQLIVKLKNIFDATFWNVRDVRYDEKAQSNIETQEACYIPKIKTAAAV